MYRFRSLMPMSGQGTVASLPCLMQLSPVLSLWIGNLPFASRLCWPLCAAFAIFPKCMKLAVNQSTTKPPQHIEKIAIAWAADCNFSSISSPVGLLLVSLCFLWLPFGRPWAASGSPWKAIRRLGCCGLPWAAFFDFHENCPMFRATAH